MDYERLIVEPRGDALWVTMNRPERLNALSRRLVEELRDLFVAQGEDFGEGVRAFLEKRAPVYGRSGA